MYIYTHIYICIFTFIATAKRTPKPPLLNFIQANCGPFLIFICIYSDTTTAKEPQNPPYKHSKTNPPPPLQNLSLGRPSLLLLPSNRFHRITRRAALGPARQARAQLCDLDLWVGDPVAAAAGLSCHCNFIW